MPSEEPNDPPNIIWIMADDLSWRDPGFMGQTEIQTPHLDRLASGGMTFTQCHSGSTVCAPSRSCLMQGRHQGHATVRENYVDCEGHVYRHSLLPGDVTVAQVLRDVGYATGLFGKWGLAVHDQFGVPSQMGFDEFFGYLNQRKAHSYYPPYLWHNRERIDLPGNVGHDCRAANEYDNAGRIIPNGIQDPTKAVYSFDLYARKGHAFVREHASEPFFLYLAYTLPHGTFEVPDLGPYRDKPWPVRHRVYAAMVSRLDAAIGELLDTLEELGLREKTLVFFVSDNGYSMEHAASDPSLDDIFHHRGPWAGKKGNLDQGGLRVPAVASWPGRIATGSQSDVPWAFWDFMPTAAEVAGAATPDGVDGISILPTLLGHPDRQAPRDCLYWEFGHQQALRLEDYWVIRRHPAEPTEVYDAIDDPAQSNNLSGDRPDIVRRAEALFHSEHTPTPYSPSPGETPEAWATRRRQAGVTLDHNVDR